MSIDTTTAQPYEAYVIEPDGTRRSIPVQFADAVHGSKTQSYRAPFTENSTAHPFSAFLKRLHSPQSDQKTGLAHRIIGVVLIALGIPMLILPGPGIAAIVVGTALLLRK